MFVIQLAIGKDDLGFIDNTQSTMIFESSTINCTSHTARRLVRHGPKAGLITLANTPPQSDHQPPHTFRLDLNSVKSEDGSPLVKMYAYRVEVGT